MTTPNPDLLARAWLSGNRGHVRNALLNLSPVSPFPAAALAVEVYDHLRRGPYPETAAAFAACLVEWSSEDQAPVFVSEEE